MINELPKILIISEATLCRHAGGAKQTLYNLFADYPPDKIMQLAPEKEVKVSPPTAPYDKNTVSCRTKMIPPMRNRIGNMIAPVHSYVNMSLLSVLPVQKLDKIQQFQPGLLLICPIGAEGLILGSKLADALQIRSVVYFMDNWMAEKHGRWYGGNVHDFTRDLLKQASGWLMISQPLKEILSKTYHLTPPETLIVHNPVDLECKSKPDFKVNEQETYRIAYAGSIWPMHFDALALVARTVYQLRNEGHPIELVLYTSAAFWNTYKSKWQKWQVAYGGFIPYEDLNDTLKQTDLLVVASSFDSKYKPYSESSVQTKITDYMASGRPVVSVGPAYSACHQFLRKHHSGFIVEDNDIAIATQFLKKRMQQREEDIQISRHAYDILARDSNATKVRHSLHEFLRNTSYGVQESVDTETGILKNT